MRQAEQELALQAEISYKRMAKRTRGEDCPGHLQPMMLGINRWLTGEPAYAVGMIGLSASDSTGAMNLDHCGIMWALSR